MLGVAYCFPPALHGASFPGAPGRSTAGHWPGWCNRAPSCSPRGQDWVYGALQEPIREHGLCLEFPVLLLWCKHLVLATAAFPSPWLCCSLSVGNAEGLLLTPSESPSAPYRRRCRHFAKVSASNVLANLAISTHNYNCIPAPHSVLFTQLLRAGHHRGFRQQRLGGALAGFPDLKQSLKVVPQWTNSWKEGLQLFVIQLKPDSL